MNTREKTKQQAEVMLAYAEGKEIEWQRDNMEWMPTTKSPIWNWHDNDYRVKKTPKVVKLWAYVGPSGQLERRFEGIKLSNWKRVPQFDLEYTEES